MPQDEGGQGPVRTLLSTSCRRAKGALRLSPCGKAASLKKASPTAKEPCWKRCSATTCLASTNTPCSVEHLNNTAVAATSGQICERQLPVIEFMSQLL